MSRVELVDKLCALPQRPLAVVTAPAGYGKTTLLMQWARCETRRVGWVSLDSRDNDPVVLLTAIASAFTRISPSSTALVDEMSVPVPVLDWAAPRLGSALRASTEPFVLMLDDVQELVEPVGMDVIDLLISHLPAGSQLATAGRAELGFVAARRGRAETIEITSADLALDGDGVIDVFAANGTVLRNDVANEVADRTEGWPAGIYLSALIARDSLRVGRSPCRSQETTVSSPTTWSGRRSPRSRGASVTS